ncbi:MAG: ACP S-malonyltransferase [Planctomycetes bacterium]|nr:ACP S-malonyltransferase [Planctomycetota bacterium]
MSVSGFLLFPGQGAQVVGMARDVVEAGGHAAALFEEASEILGFDLGDMVFNGDDATLAQTENCQPALLTASIAILETLRERVGINITGAAGLSLGEYTALVALDAIDFADAVRLVRKRGELMEAAGRGKDSTMATILGLDNDVVEKVCREASAAGLGVVVPANYNSPGQLVISGERPAVEKASELAKEAGAKRALLLNVSAAFHSPVMQSAQVGLREALAEVPLREPSAKFVNNADAKVLKDPEAIRESLSRQVVSSVCWEQSCNLILGEGDATFFEIGPGKVCQGLMKRINRDASVTSISTLEDIEALAL